MMKKWELQINEQSDGTYLTVQEWLNEVIKIAPWTDSPQAEFRVVALLLTLALTLAWETERAEQATKVKGVEWSYDCGCWFCLHCGFWWQPMGNIPKETGIIYCPGCGGKIREVRP